MSPSAEAGSNATSGLVEELEAAVASKDLRRQSQVMRSVTDLFLASHRVAKFDQAELFDEVMSALIGAVDESVRAEFGCRLAALPNAPAGTLRRLALDDAIKVAGPILENSIALNEATIVESAKTQSQAHLLAIARRKALPIVVTDILVRRGEEAVVLTAAGNPGARFSDDSAAMLSERACDNPELACRLLSRSDIPRQHLLAMFERASEQVTARLVETDRTKAELFRGLVAQATDHVREMVRGSSKGYAAAEAAIKELQRDGRLDESQIKAFADARSFDEVLVALAFSCDLPVPVVEQALAGQRIDQLLVIAKAAKLSWETTRSILQLMKPSDIQAQREVFGRLQLKTAQTALQYYRLRSRALDGSGSKPLH